MGEFWEAVRHFDFWGWIAVIAIGTVLIEAIVRVIKMMLVHSERMAMIEHGMDPGSLGEMEKGEPQKKKDGV